MAHTVSLVIAGVLVAAGVSAVPFESTITPRLIDEAVGVGQGRIEATRLRYHQPYRMQVGRAPIDYIEIVTPFRRVVLLAEERMRGGSRGFTQREAIAALGDKANVIELRVEMTFHPLNAFVGVPAYDVELIAVSQPAIRLKPGEVARIPRFGPRTDMSFPTSSSGGLAGLSTSEPLTGGTIVATFPVQMLDGSGVYEIVVSEKGQELGRARVNFGTLR